MKKWIYIFLILFSSLTAYSQRPTFFGLNRFGGAPNPPDYPYFGTWGSGSSPSDNVLDDFAAYRCVGVQLIYQWSTIEPTKNNKNFSSIGSDIQKCLDRNLNYVGVQINAGPDAPITGGADWLVSVDGVATFTTSGGNENGPYPDYYNANYIAAYYSLYEELFSYINGLSASLKGAVLYVKVVWGSTGDTGPWKGNSCTPSNCLGIQDNDVWSTYVRDTYTYIHGLRDAENGLDLTLAMNPGNDAKELTWVTSTFPLDFVKKGDLGHDYYFDYEILHPKAGYVSMSEIQGYILTSAHQVQEVFPLVCSELDCQLKIPNITGGWANDNISKEVTDFFNEMISQTTTSTATKGFIMLAQKISFDSTNVDWLTTGTYGNVIGNVPAYNAKIAQINASSDGEAYKDVLRYRAQQTYINSTRVAQIKLNANPYAMYSGDADSLYYNDFGYGLKTNYQLNVSQNNVHTTSTGRYRITQSPDTSIYGRFGAEYIINAGSGAMSFDIDNAWASGATSGAIRFTVVYFNDGTGQWSFQANTGSGMANQQTFTNTNTDKWIKTTFDVANVQLGTNEDFKLRYTSGNNTIYCFIKFEKLSE